MITATARLSLFIILAHTSRARLSQEPLTSQDLSIIRGSEERKILNVNDGSICVLLKQTEDGNGKDNYINLLLIIKYRFKILNFRLFSGEAGWVDLQSQERFSLGNTSWL